MASPFSFHCMICFEEFNIETRFPVVLPCGHTYVCNQCAERLDKCMECRTSLVQIVPQNTPVSQSLSQSTPPLQPMGRWGSTRVGQGHQGVNRSPPPAPIKKRLPLPKNVVLMSLIEATELAAENVRGGESKEPSLTNSPAVNITPSDIENDEEQKIKTGTSLAISDCGTYAVAAREGLQIFPSHPESMLQPKVEESEQDVDSLLRFFHRDHKQGEDIMEEEHSSEKVPPPVKLKLGDRVQIVSTEAGWAKLARGYGYIKAGGNELVKVGGSVDRACKLEALLRLLSAKRKELKTEQKKADNQFIALMNELQVSFVSDEDLTVIAADTFTKKTSKETSKKTSEGRVEVRDNKSSDRLEVRSPNSVDWTPLKPRPMERPVTPPAETSSRGFFCAGTDVFDTVIPLGSASFSRQPPPLPCSSRSPTIVEALQQTRSSHSMDSAASRMLAVNSASHPSPNALREGARAWREQHGRPVAVNAGIDFRTGRSGHAALTSSSVHPHDFLDPRQGSAFRGMSNHTGLTMWKSGRRQPAARTTNLAMPALPGGSSWGENNTVD